MLIAGVEQVDVEVFHVNEDQIEAVITGKGVDETTEFYTHNQVRDILIKFANSKNAMRRDMAVAHIVDEFMESGE